MCGFESRLQHFRVCPTVKEFGVMYSPSRTVDADELSAVFDDHTESIYLGPWKELVVGHLRLLRGDDDAITVEELVEDCAL